MSGIIKDMASKTTQGNSETVVTICRSQHIVTVTNRKYISSFDFVCLANERQCFHLNQQPLKQQMSLKKIPLPFPTKVTFGQKVDNRLLHFQRE